MFFFKVAYTILLPSTSVFVKCHIQTVVLCSAMKWAIHREHRAVYSIFSTEQLLCAVGAPDPARLTAHSLANSSVRLCAGPAHTRSLNFHYLHQALPHPLLLSRSSADGSTEHFVLVKMRDALAGLCIGIILLLNSGFVVMRRQDSSSALGSIFRTRCAARCLSLHSTRIALSPRHFQVRKKKVKKSECYWVLNSYVPSKTISLFCLKYSVCFIITNN